MYDILQNPQALQKKKSDPVIQRNQFVKKQEDLAQQKSQFFLEKINKIAKERRSQIRQLTK